MSNAIGFEVGGELDEAGVREIETLRADLAHEKTMRAGAEHRATYAEKTQQEYARTVERLRALIKKAERAATDNERVGMCPWCEWGNKHADDCPAFAADGAVR